VQAFELVSEDGEEGFPGRVLARVEYTESAEWTDKREEVSVLEIDYEVMLDGEGDEIETAVNLTNHSYFNISDGPTIENTRVTLSTNQHLPVNKDVIPIGSIESYPGIKSNEPFTLGPTGPDVDHCFIVDTDAHSIPIDTRSHPLTRYASFYHPDTRINLEVHGTDPAFQFYGTFHRRASGT